MDRILKRQQRTVGAIVQIPLENGSHTYARILENSFAFYNIHTKEILPVEEILQKEVLFITAVYDTAVTKGYWPKISKAIALEEKFIAHNLPAQYVRDNLNPNRYTIYNSKGIFRATKEECEGLEQFIIWTHDTIEDRLSDHYAGRPNISTKHFDDWCEMRLNDLKTKQTQ
jgi:Immunity protein 26